MSMEELSALNKSRGAVKRKLTLTQNAVAEFNKGSDKSLAEIEDRLRRLEPLYDEFINIQCQIEELETSLNLPSSTEQATAFSKDYYSVFRELRNLEGKCRSTSTPHSSSINQRPISNGNQCIPVKLPELALPTFDGSYAEWTSFRDTFSALVDDNANLSDVHKFHYLKSCLKGKAVKVIESLKVTADNYASAWTILQNRFDNKRLIVQDHVYGILNFPNINKASHTELRKLLDTMCSHLEALAVHQITPERFCDIILISIISEKLDYTSKREWQSKLTSELPTWDELKHFLEKRSEMLETLGLMSGKASNNYENNSKRVPNKIVASVSTGKKTNVNINRSFSCPHCSENHYLYHCPTFLNLSTSDRLNFVQAKNSCVNCFRDHDLSNCKSENRCRICNQNHNTLLHQNQPESNPLSYDDIDQQPAVFKLNTSQSHFSGIILPTAQVQICDNLGRKHIVRALLDSGSELNFISERLARLLKLKSQPIVMSISGVNHCTTNASKRTNAQIFSNCTTFHFNLSCVIIHKISECLPSNSFSTANLKFPNHIELADPSFHVKGEIDLLIGAQLFFELLEPNQVYLNENFLLQETKLGYVVVNSVSSTPSVVNRGTCHYIQPTLEQLVGKFWELDNFQNSIVQTADEVLCERIFMEGHKRLRDGRYSVPLPFQQNADLGTSKSRAIKRLKSLESKFRKDRDFKDGYSRVISDYLQQGHAEQVPEDQIENPQTFYLPHHGVTKESSNTTKLRVVFDASAKSSNHKSLNDVLLIGPNIQSNLYSILLRFRQHKIAVTADISQMYRQILVHPEHHDYQRFLWRFEENAPIETYRLKTVTFGVAPAPFLAIRTLHQLSLDEKHNFPNAYDQIRNNMYVDDLITGANTVEEVLNIKTEISQCLQKGGFQLRKWASNNPSLLPNTSAHSAEINLDKEGLSKTLGVIWNCISDHIKYSINLTSIKTAASKMSVLSTIAQLFDPLGLVAPVVVTAKIILQQLWTLKLDWDDRLPANLEERWNSFLDSLADLNKIIIPRCVIPVEDAAHIQLHGFCDASQLAYGACIYIRSYNERGEIHVQLLTAKSRIAPLKTQTLPRLELCGAVLLAELSEQVKHSLSCQIQGEFYYTDSTIVLSWLAATPNTWTTFVANRVSRIQSLTKIETWKHVSSISNPADVISRGCSPEQLMKNSLWLSGPTFLWQPTTNHSSSLKNYVNPSETEERRKVVCTKVTKSESKCDLLSRYSSFSKLVNVIAWCLRFHNNVKSSQKLTGSLSAYELRNSRMIIIRLVQRESFFNEFDNLSNYKSLPKSSPLIKLNPFLDENALIRVGGRLVNANIFYDKKFPIVLPKDHYITHLIIECEHLRQLHAGPQATLTAVRQTYWPLGGRSTIRKVLHKCARCRRANPIFYQEIMANLPEARVNLVRPFLTCGVDYAGPMLIREGRGRGKRSIKAYVCLFICLSTKAIHLELVTDCTSSAFIGAFKRFISRRGKPSTIYSDNATTFKGSNRELRFIHQDIIKSESFRKFIGDCAGDNIEWRFIPPRSPHVGGIWEAGIKSMKFHLKRVVGQSLFTYEEMYTYLTLIEACLNSRPITPLSSSPDDLTAITPGHFLIGSALTAPAEHDLSTVNIHRLDQWQKIQQLRHHFWKRWSREYLLELQQRSKWATSARPAAVGDIVIIHEDHVPPLCWTLGRIEITHPGRDGRVRTVSVRTKNGIIQRSVHKLCPLLS